MTDASTSSGPSGGSATGDPTDVDGPAAPPRANGELVFTAPWQSRMFATTLQLHDAEYFEWDRFRDGLIAQIAVHEQAITDPEDYDYWGCWQRALEALLDDITLVSTSQLDETSAVLAARPAGHDHDHGHDHSHDHDHDHSRGHDHDHPADHEH